MVDILRIIIYTNRKYKLKRILFHILQGMIIGVANIIPGISGSTLAVILGIYEKLIDIITKFDIRLLSLMKELNFNAVQKHISLSFLLSISLGIIISYMIQIITNFIEEFASMQKGIRNMITKCPALLMVFYYCFNKMLLYGCFSLNSYIYFYQNIDNSPQGFYFI